MARYLVVRDFAKFQHYKDRNPPWIKFHSSTLSNYDITSLPDAAQGQLFKFWLVASRHDNLIPYDLKFIKREIRAYGRLYIKELIASGLLEVREQDASTALAPRARSRESEVETETETEKEAAAAPTFSGRNLLLTALTEPLRQRAMAAAIWQYESGHDLPPGLGIPTPEQIDQTCTEVMATVGPGGLSPKVFRRFLVRTMRGEDDRPPTRGSNSLIDALLRPSGAA